MLGGNATLVDFSAQALQVAQRNAIKQGLADRVSFIQDDVLNFVAQTKYDLVHSAGLIEHSPMPLMGKFVRKHVECASAHGYVILMAPAPVWWYRAMRKLLEGIHRWPKDFETPLNKERLESITEKNGVNVLKSLQSGGLARASAIVGVPK
jgi:cyclopropane fatty-acyl-phospholipid synthase-like methyltransferase